MKNIIINNNGSIKIVKAYLESINESNKVLSKVYVTERIINAREDFSFDIYSMRKERKELNYIFNRINKIKAFIKIQTINSLFIFNLPIETVIKKSDISKIKKVISSFNLKNKDPLMKKIEDDISNIINIINTLYNAIDFKKIVSLSKKILNNEKNITIERYEAILKEKVIFLKNNNNTQNYKMHLKVFEKIFKYSHSKFSYYLESYIDEKKSLLDNLRNLVQIYNTKFFEIKKDHTAKYPLDIIPSEYVLLKLKNIRYTRIIYYSTKNLKTKIIDNPRCITYSLDQNNKIVINHFEIKDLEQHKWNNIRELEKMIFKIRYTAFLRFTSLFLISTGPFLFFLPGPAVLSWIGFAMFLVYYSDFVSMVLPFLPLWFQDLFLKYEVEFNKLKKIRDLKKSFEPVNHTGIKNDLLKIDSTLTREEIAIRIKKIEDQHIIDIKIYNEQMTLKVERKHNEKAIKAAEKIFDNSFFENDSLFYDSYSDSIFDDNWKTFNKKDKKNNYENSKVLNNPSTPTQTRSVYQNNAPVYDLPIVENNNDDNGIDTKLNDYYEESDEDFY